jgi:hypothetical protein
MSTRRQFAFLLLTGALLSPAASKNAVLNASNVTIVSFDANHLVVSRTVKGKTEQLQFVLNPDTVRSGGLIVGARVTVHYTTRNHENVATSIQSLGKNPATKF